jgi:hypothetical protein
MLISGREARALLEAAGFSSRHARIALSRGLGGEPIRTRAAHLYDEARVRDLAARAAIGWSEVHEICPEGIFVARRDLDVSLSLPAQFEHAARGWGDLNPWVWMLMGFQVRARGSLPFVLTVAGVVVFGADIVGMREGCELRLERPDRWFDRLQGRRLSTGPGRPWVVHLSDNLRQHDLTQA